MGLAKPKVGRRAKKSATLEIGIWRGAGDHIHIAANAEGFPTTVSPSKRSSRYHPNLYKKLKRILEEKGLW